MYLPMSSFREPFSCISYMSMSAICMSAGSSEEAIMQYWSSPITASQRNQRVAAAACVLTLSESSAISRDLGTRHRAGLGISESTDAIVLIVSEETGIISMAKGGRLTRHLDAEAIRKQLRSIYHEDHSRLWQWRHKQRPLSREGGAANDE